MKPISELSDEELSAVIAVEVMGWEALDLDYWADPKRPKEHPDWIPCEAEDGWLGNPGMVKWHALMEREQVYSVGQYWVDPHAEKIREGDWSPATKIEHAWEVVEKLIANGWLWLIHYNGKVWAAGLGRPIKIIEPEAPTAPRAICEAALAAMREAGK